MSKKLGATLMVALLSMLAISPSAFAQSPIGVWKTIDDETGKPTSHIELYERQGKLHGKLVKLLDSPEDSKCEKCDGKRKGQPLMGMVVLWDLKKEDDEWEDGTILDPAKGKTYDVKIWLEGKDKLKVRGYIGFLYRTQTWHRVK